VVGRVGHEVVRRWWFEIEAGRPAAPDPHTVILGELVMDPPATDTGKIKWPSLCEERRWPTRSAQDYAGLGGRGRPRRPKAQ
jgi:hypothetical protein